MNFLRVSSGALAMVAGFLLSACAGVGIGVDGPGYDGYYGGVYNGYYEPYGYDYGGWGPGYYVGPGGGYYHGRDGDFHGDHGGDHGGFRGGDHGGFHGGGHGFGGHGGSPGYRPAPMGRATPSIPGRSRGH